LVTSVIGVPDSKGIIRVSCGGDTIEINVISRGSAEADVPQVTPENDQRIKNDPSPHPIGPQDNAPKNPWDTPVNPGDVPTNWFHVPSTDGRFDPVTLIDQFRRQTADPGQANPEAVFVVTPTANLHDLARLREQLDREAPGLPIGFRMNEKLP
jgi:hypothetical protein